LLTKLGVSVQKALPGMRLTLALSADFKVAFKSRNSVDGLSPA
jgi:hypothetical protein